MQQETQQQANGMWAIVELFGHQRIAGFMSEHVIAGQGFVRVDVPELPAATRYGSSEGPIGAHTKMFGAGAIYAINPVDETIARAAAAEIRHAPVQTYGMRDVLRSMSETDRQRLLSAPGADEDDYPLPS